MGEVVPEHWFVASFALDAFGLVAYFVVRRVVLWSVYGVFCSVCAMRLIALCSRSVIMSCRRAVRSLRCVCRVSSASVVCMGSRVSRVFDVIT